MRDTIWTTQLDGLPEPRRGKVRDIYDLGDTMLIVACDRLSAYDRILEPGIPGKGKILNQMTNFWFERLSEVIPNHLLATEAADFPTVLKPHRDLLDGRSVLVRKADVVPFECVARGYLAGSGFREYTADGKVCGIPLPPGLQRASRLAEPIFTPATKAETGHDENIDFDTLIEGVGEELADRLRSATLEIYRRGHEHAEKVGLLLADTKYEFGFIGDRLVLIDEVMTPDSSRYWEASSWTPGVEPQSVDKQYVRNWLDDAGWDHESPAPVLPDEVVRETAHKYEEAFRRITGTEPKL
jgi:phosphoribosylaminoimidazole-succinocarboxamide synthase